MTQLIILAAGRGSRMKEFCADQPKGELLVDGVSLIERQLKCAREIGVGSSVIVGGYKFEKLVYNAQLVVNEEYQSTNSVYSLFLAREYVKGDVIVTYADLVFSPDLFRAVQQSDKSVGILADTNWQDYWMWRYGNLNTDLETFEVLGDQIISLGTEVSSATGITHRYVGINKFSYDAFELVMTFYEDCLFNHVKTGLATSVLLNISFTSFLQLLIDYNILPIQIIECQSGWIELDTFQDFKKLNQDWCSDNSFARSRVSVG